MTLSLSLVGTERRLSRPALNAHQSWSTRAAIIVTLEATHGLRGAGEAAPLPGFSPDTLADCQAALAGFDASALPARPEPGLSVVDQLQRASARLPDSVPAARAALEAALLDLWSRAAHEPAWALLCAERTAPKPRAVAALLMGDLEHTLSEAARAEARGLRTFKLKIGRPGMLERELAVTRELRQMLGVNARLRLDANQSFSAQQASVCLPRFAEHGVEFVEEPSTFVELTHMSTVVPLALDESLSRLALDSKASRTAKVRGARALVLKPTLLGGIAACYAWAAIADTVGADVIVSHTFDGPRGLALSAALALGIGSESLAHGLDVEGARLEQPNLPFFTGTHVRAWPELGLGVGQAGS